MDEWMSGYHALHDSHATRFHDAGSLTISIYLSIRLGTWVEQQLAKLESDAATKASLKASSGQRRASTASTTP